MVFLLFCGVLWAIVVIVSCGGGGDGVGEVGEVVGIVVVFGISVGVGVSVGGDFGCVCVFVCSCVYVCCCVCAG